MNDPRHVPVALTRVLDLLEPVLTKDSVMVDATTGLGGHPAAVLSRFDPGGQPCTQERLFRMLSHAGYVPRWVSVDHESHWMFVPSERADG